MDSQASLNPTAAAMLGLLAQIGPVNGNGLSQRADILIGEYWTLTRSQVYRELHALEQRGYITAGAAGPRASRDYSLTPAGAVAFREWLHAGPAHEVIRFPMLLTIRFAEGLDPTRLRELLGEFATGHHAKLAYYAQLESDLRANSEDSFELATVRFGRLFAQAVAAWLPAHPPLVPPVFADVDTTATTSAPALQPGAAS